MGIARGGPGIIGPAILDTIDTVDTIGVQDTTRTLTQTVLDNYRDIGAGQQSENELQKVKFNLGLDNRQSRTGHRQSKILATLMISHFGN